MEFRHHGPTGSNLIEAYDKNQGVINGYMGQEFLGYGDDKSFSIAQIQKFIINLLTHTKRTASSHIIIDFFGVIQEHDPTPEPKPKKKHHKVDRDAKANHRGNRGFGKR